MKRRDTAVLLGCLLAILSSTAMAAPEPLDPARVQAIGRMLPATPQGVGPTIDDRQAWQTVANTESFKSVVDRAEGLLSRPMPELTDELFLDYSKTGNRTRCQRVLSDRHGRLPQLVLAECIENRGRFLPAIEATIRAICSERTWVMPAHDGGLRNFNRTTHEIDLAVAGLSWNLATTYYWLGEKLSPEIRGLIRDELETRTFTPMTGMVTKGQPRLWWATGTNNWNAVCLAGVTGSAMAVIESPERRAFFLAAAERYIQYFLSGFTADGYCSEGVGYWNYGFGHYVTLSETLFQSTGGKLDWFQGEKIRRIAEFGRRMEIAPGIYPAFADCSVGTRPSTPLMAFLSRRFSMGLDTFERDGLLLKIGPTSRLFDLGLYGFANSATAIPPAEPAAGQPLRDWYSDAQILICRPAPGRTDALAVSIKGGHNAEHHNHNDVGSYLVVLGGDAPLVDPGAEVYTARTFSNRRYESGVLNSFGHPVPLVAGKQQRTGRQAAGKILQTEFTDEADTITIDLRAAYDVAPLTKLTRTFVFTRNATGTFTVTDEVAFDSPQTFGTALITFAKWKQLDANRLQIGESPSATEVTIATGNQPYRIQSTEIKEDVRGGRTPTRLAIDLVEPTETAKITVTISPARQ
ncbi:MAG: heparinase II/III family protein [Thermoguttaceae bacterium]